MYDARTTLRLKQAGMEFAVWVFKHAEAAQIQAVAPAVLRGLLHLLDDGALKLAFRDPFPKSSSNIHPSQIWVRNRVVTCIRS